MIYRRSFYGFRNISVTGTETKQGLKDHQKNRNSIEKEFRVNIQSNISLIRGIEFQNVSTMHIHLQLWEQPKREPFHALGIKFLIDHIRTSNKNISKREEKTFLLFLNLNSRSVRDIRFQELFLYSFLSIGTILHSQMLREKAHQQ